MASFLFKNHSTRILGATFLLLGAATTPSQATTLTGFSTYGNMMSGVQVTANFLDGSSQSITWSATGNNSGGAIGNSWALTQSGNTYNSPWTFSNYGVGIISLIIDAIPGNTVFDTYPLLYGPLQTPNSAEGWEFQTTSGQSPTSYTYSDAIDISHGDLFGTLSLYWTSGFAGVTQFRADTDSGSSNDPVRPRNPGVRDVPPTVYFSAPTIYEGESASTFVYATDPGEDAITFFLNGSNFGTDFAQTGTRSRSAELGFFADNGEYIYTAQARDEDGNYSNPVTSTLTVLNVAPTVTDLNIPAIYEGQWASADIFAIDPGADSVSFFLNDTEVGTDPSTSGTRFVSVDLGYFADNGYIPYTGYALDKDGAWSEPFSAGLTVLNVAPTLTNFSLSSRVIYEGQSASAYMDAIDPGADWQRFFINGNNVGTDLQTSGTRSLVADLGTFADEGSFTFRGQARDKDRASSNVLRTTLTVLNVAPTITQLTGDLTVNINDLFDFAAAATDPGIYDLLTFDWDFNMDGLFDDFTGSSGQWLFGDEGVHEVGLRVSDGDGGYTYDSFMVTVLPIPIVPDSPVPLPNPTVPDSSVPNETVPEPSSVLGILAFGAIGAGAAWRRKQQQKAQTHNLN